jgi:hypothetical protein
MKQMKHPEAERQLWQSESPMPVYYPSGQTRQMASVRHHTKQINAFEVNSRFQGVTGGPP